MKKTACIVLLIVLLAACSNKNKLPNGILPQPKMQAIMWELLSTGEFLNAFVFPKDTAINQVTESQPWYNKIFELHQTTKAQFEKSYAYYREHPAVMKVLLDSLSNRTYKPDTLQVVTVDTVQDITADTSKKEQIDPARAATPDSLKKKIRRIPAI